MAEIHPFEDKSDYESDFYRQEKMSVYGFCGCCDTDIVETIEKLIGKNYDEIADELKKEFKNLSFFEGFLGIIIETLNSIVKKEGKEVQMIKNKHMDAVKFLVKNCIKFLYLEKIGTFSTYKYENSPKKYIALYSFIYDFLMIPNVRGFPYFIMNYLENTEASEIFENGINKKIIDHGSAIRCAYLNLDTEYAQNLTEEIDSVSIVKTMFEPIL